MHIFTVCGCVCVYTCTSWLTLLVLLVNSQQPVTLSSCSPRGALYLELQRAPSSVPVSLCLDVQTFSRSFLYNYSLAVYFLPPSCP